MSARKPQLTESQQRDIDRARKVAESTAQEIAGDYEHAQRYPEAYALGVAQATIKHLLEVIDQLTGGAS